MPPLISFMINRVCIGFALGGVAGFIIWANGFSDRFSYDSAGLYVAQGLFIYLFASTIGAGYLATALFQEDG